MLKTLNRTFDEKQSEEYSMTYMEMLACMDVLDDQIKCNAKTKAITPLVTHYKSTNLSLNSRKNYPPKLVIINDDNSMNNCFVVGGGIQVDIGNDAKDAVTKLLFCYYVWDLSYPRQYQFLCFLQTSVLEDKENTFDMSGSYLKFTQKYEEKLKQKYS